MHLYEVLAQQIAVWRQEGYPCEEYPVIAEILDWATDPPGDGFRLRASQQRALETYWHLRLLEGTPHIFDLYERLFSKKKNLLDALGIPDGAFQEVDYDMDTLWVKIKSDDDFVRRYRFQALRETLSLDYPSYILALAMGAGKTVLIGAIIATEFAMALEYPDAPFVQNALVFAPGKTIIESLRELADVRYDRILPPRLFKDFSASVKLTFTRDGDPDISIIAGSLYNLVVTNTEKIRIQKENIRKKDLGPLFVSAEKEDEARMEVANRRLQKIASLPQLAIFSDEAHHTYGQALDRELKKVRKTVDYLAQNTSLICVVNTTGTPYFRRQLLRDVVIWYGLSEGISDGILKEVAGNIYAFDFDPSNTGQFVAHVIEDFFNDYGNVALPNGAPAKMALYFPQTDDLEELRPAVEAKLAELGFSPALVLRTDPKYGQFFVHQPAQARVDIRRLDGMVRVEIQDVLSPSIVERLKAQSGLLSPRIDDWRAVVDTVMIDAAYDGEVFRIVLSDVPERKSDLVQGAYELPAPDGETTVAVKIIDMLGEEILVTQVV